MEAEPSHILQHIHIRHGHTVFISQAKLTHEPCGNFTAAGYICLADDLEFDEISEPSNAIEMDADVPPQIQVALLLDHGTRPGHETEQRFERVGLHIGQFEQMIRGSPCLCGVFTAICDQNGPRTFATAKLQPALVRLKERVLLPEQPGMTCAEPFRSRADGIEIAASYLHLDIVHSAQIIHAKAGTINVSLQLAVCLTLNRIGPNCKMCCRPAHPLRVGQGFITTEEAQMALYELLDVNSIKIDLESESTEEVVAELIELLVQAGRVEDRYEAIDAILDREAKGSTGIGSGVALPHARLESIPELTAALGLSRTGVEFDAIDHKPVHVVMLLLAKAGEPGPHVIALQETSTLLSIPRFIERLLACKTPQEALDLIRSEEMETIDER